jgi:hypothetical protein
LKVILATEEKSFEFWNDQTKHRMNFTRQAQIERRFNKRIQALKIVIYMLTPYTDRVEDEPAIVVKKVKPKKVIKGYLPPSSTVPDRSPEQMPAMLSSDQISLLAGLADLLKVKK